jgi:type VI secretion system secreted protein Hcp
MKTNRILTLVLLLAIAPVVSRAALFDAFLEIKGIEGETDSRTGQIVVLSYSFGVSNPGLLPGNTTGRVNVHDIVITKHVDKASVKLLQACAQGKHFEHAVLTVSRGNGKGSVEIVKISMEDVIISSYQTGGGAGNSLPTDQVSLSFGKVKAEYGESSVELNVGDTPES